MPDPVSKDKIIADLNEALQAATAKLKEQDAALKEMTKMPSMLAQVTDILPKHAERGETIVLDGRMLVERPKDKKFKELEEGDFVQVNQGPDGKTLTVVDKIQIPLKPQATMKVAEIVGDRIFIDLGQGNILPLKKSLVKCEVGDRLLVGGSGPTNAVALENLGKETKRFQFTDETAPVTWDDVGGQEEAKVQMREAIEYPIRYAEHYKALGKRPIKGVLLEGPPGCGKTLLAKAAASALSTLHGKTAVATGYIYVKGPEVLSKWVGEAESTIRSLFTMAREHHTKHGYPAIVFIDECEALLSKRGTGVSSDMEKTIVPSFLAELDGLGTSGAMVILATNRGERLDSAVIRDGRIDRRIRISRPSREDAVEIFQIHISKVPSAKPNAKFLAKHAALHMYSDSFGIYNVDIGHAAPMRYTLAHCASGAMIAGIVDRATSVVLHEAIAAKAKPRTIEPAHLEAAIASVYADMFNLDHSDDLAFLASLQNAKVKGKARIAA